MSVVYSAGWSFPFHGAYVPISIAAVPTPEDGYPSFGVFTGFSFACKAEGQRRPGRAR